MFSPLLHQKDVKDQNHFKQQRLPCLVDALPSLQPRAKARAGLSQISLISSLDQNLSDQYLYPEWEDKGGSWITSNF